MPERIGVGNWSLRFCKTGTQLDLGESRSPTPCSQRNLQPLSFRFWVYLCAFGLELMVMVMMVMVISVRNGSGLSLWVRVQVQTKPLRKWRSRWSINPNRRLGYCSLVNSQSISIGRVVSRSPSGSIHRFI